MFTKRLELLSLSREHANVMFSVLNDPELNRFILEHPPTSQAALSQGCAA